MNITQAITSAFKRFMPSPFTIAVLLTLLTMMLAFFFTPDVEGNKMLFILSEWEKGIWNTDLLVFGYQMMLILVLGHILVLSKPMNKVILAITTLVTNGKSAVVMVCITTMLVAFFNWGLGLIFGAILARKVAEYAQQNNIPINYPLLGAAGYSGLMVWHGGISGSAPLKVAEKGHLKGFINTIEDKDIAGMIPELISTDQTIFSWWNLLIFGAVLIIVPLVLRVVSEKTTATPLQLNPYNFDTTNAKADGAEKLDSSKYLAWFFGILILLAFSYQYSKSLTEFTITPNMLNFFMFGLAIVLHGSFTNFLKALNEAIQGTSGILIQFPLYFGIMGIMKSTGMVSGISDFFVSIATEDTLPIVSFFSAGLVNIFVPSGGGQWAIQGPIVVESALSLNVPLPKAIMALAYGDQITNMLQPFWALPLLGITKLKAKEILPYTLILMLVGGTIYLLGLLLL
ncbi:TIGR00366 family protein [Spongiivirga sp. MCCC 1A20706]|uniref:short-chain fatty acid transporter n=1 Tax=Spongiivirga sp. MCCC 1A20706 TaxID=3160963 RepID=UPI00397730B1